MKIDDEKLVIDVIGAAIEVHRILGPGLLESAYEIALACELSGRGMNYERQRSVPVTYKGKELQVGFRADMFVETQIVLELKTVDRLIALHTAQLISYLKLLDIKRGLILNFNSAPLKNGIKRVSI